MKIVGEEKPVVRPVVRKVFTVVSLAWSGITLSAWITMLAVWPEGHVKSNLFLDVIAFVFMFGSLGSLPVALLAIPMNITKRMKIIIGIAGALPLAIFVTFIIISIPYVA
jgi:hypothetical protein